MFALGEIVIKANFRKIMFSILNIFLLSSNYLLSKYKATLQIQMNGHLDGPYTFILVSIAILFIVSLKILMLKMSNAGRQKSLEEIGQALFLFFIGFFMFMYVFVYIFPLIMYILILYFLYKLIRHRGLRNGFKEMFKTQLQSTVFYIIIIFMCIYWFNVYSKIHCQYCG